MDNSCLKYQFATSGRSSILPASDLLILRVASSLRDCLEGMNRLMTVIFLFLVEIAASLHIHDKLARIVCMGKNKSCLNLMGKSSSENNMIGSIMTSNFTGVSASVSASDCVHPGHIIMDLREKERKKGTHTHFFRHKLFLNFPAILMTLAQSSYFNICIRIDERDTKNNGLQPNRCFV